MHLFHNNCVRALCSVTMWHVQEYKISQANLEHRLLLEHFDLYLARRRLRWAGHVGRMPMYRLPRLLLSSWVDHTHPQQRPQFTYGHGLKRDLNNVEVKNWGSLAMNHNPWHAITQQKNVYCNSNGGGYAWMDELEVENPLLMNASCHCRPRMRESFLRYQLQVHLTRCLLTMSSFCLQTRTVTIVICSPLEHCPHQLTYHDLLP